MVKTVLQHAVRGEVEQLKQQIQDLERSFEILERENRLLREFAPPDFLVRLPELLARQQLSSPSATSMQTEAVPAALAVQQEPAQQSVVPIPAAVPRPSGPAVARPAAVAGQPLTVEVPRPCDRQLMTSSTTTAASSATQHQPPLQNNSSNLIRGGSEPVQNTRQ